jgi:hypothetical protein
MGRRALTPFYMPSLSGPGIATPDRRKYEDHSLCPPGFASFVERCTVLGVVLWKRRDPRFKPRSQRALPVQPASRLGTDRRLPGATATLLQLSASRDFAGARNEGMQYPLGSATLPIGSYNHRADRGKRMRCSSGPE